MTQRIFIAGDEWLFYKVYCGIKTSDFLLTESISPLVRYLKEHNLIHSWFFVRYQDPDPHIRFRLRIINLDEVGLVISICNKFFRPFIEKNQVWKLQADTYVRELERYGKNTIANVEEIFYHDSELLLDILNFSRIESDILHWVLISVDSFLKVFGLSLQERVIFHRANFLAYKDRLEMDFGKIRVSANKFQNEMLMEIKDKLYDQQLINHTKIQSYIERRNNKISSSVNEIILHNQKGNSDIIFYELLQSLVHMFYNKAFNHQQIMYEYVGNYLLFKLGNTELIVNENE
ncbi:MAG: thiopeptide-type bacteriocin biosynthesis protein [Ignavibacteria bacterium]|nr:thiopeptide-type bacteriocin biosynthesis protein [Ignavibacteria bacterium]